MMAGTSRTNSRVHAICPRRAGVTLIELLVVLAILLALTTVAVRSMNTDNKSRRQREAARSVSICLSSARYRALETGRPCGVRFDRMAGSPECSIVVQHVETPAPYAGEFLDSTCTVKAGSAAGGRISVTATFSPAPPAGRINAGDLIQFGGQGPWYRVDAAGGGSASIDGSQGQVVPWAAGASQAVPFRVLRTPTKTVAMPLQLPAGAVIDLACSGMDPNIGFQSSGNAGPLIITFSPNGSIDRVWLGGVPIPVTQPIFLLIGKPERLVSNQSITTAPLVDDGLPNWKDLTNFWIAINSQNGMTTTAEVASPTNIIASREYARKAQSVGGR